MDMDDGYTTTEEEIGLVDDDDGGDDVVDVPASRIPALTSPRMGMTNDAMLEISSSDEVSDGSPVDDMTTSSPGRPSVTRSAGSGSTSSFRDGYGTSVSASRRSVPEIASASRISASRGSMGVSTSSDRGSTSRASFAGRLSRDSVRTTPIYGNVGSGAATTTTAATAERMSTTGSIGGGVDGGSTSVVRPGVNLDHANAPTRQPSVSTTPGAQSKPNSGTKRPPIKPVAVLSPARIIAEFKRGSMSKQQAVESLIRYRMNKMLHKNSDRMYVDKDGDVRFVKGYDFGKSRDDRGRVIKRNGFTRIEREILAYQKSTHLLIPRAVFARIVREIAQTWWRGPEPVKFTVEALSALQAATEDEITRLLEISTACSYHAKRITLRIDDMRLARFCRGRQEYEFFNIKS